MKVLVTGGAGFIGTHVARILRDADYNVITSTSNIHPKTLHMSIARAFLLTLRMDISGEAINVVSPTGTSIRELARMVIAEIPAEICYTPARLGDVQPAQVSAEKARRLLGWSPEVLFQEAPQELIKMYRSIFSKTPRQQTPTAISALNSKHQSGRIRKAAELDKCASEEMDAEPKDFKKRAIRQR